MRYQVEYEGVSRSGRWYRGQVSEAQARSATAENARSILEQLDPSEALHEELKLACAR